MRPSPVVTIVALLGGCAARSPEVAEPTAARGATATAARAAPPADPSPAPASALHDATSRKEEAIREAEQRVERELAEARNHPEPPPPPEPYAVCETPLASPQLAACKPGRRAGSCRECPSYTSFAGPGTSGQVAFLLRGSFSGTYEEALMVVGGCEPHSENYGALLLVRKVDGGWAKVVYLRGVVPRCCEAGAKVGGATRVVCLETYGMNGGTYVTQASLIDFRARRVDLLVHTECEDGIDVEGVHWSDAEKSKLRVSVTHGEQRDNDGSGCVRVGGTSRPADLDYVETNGEFVPTPATEQQLRDLKVRQLLPTRVRLSFDEPNCMAP